jgi:hypothetical protein
MAQWVYCNKCGFHKYECKRDCTGNNNFIHTNNTPVPNHYEKYYKEATEYFDNMTNEEFTKISEEAGIELVENKKEPGLLFVEDFFDSILNKLFDEYIETKDNVLSGKHVVKGTGIRPKDI